MDRVGDVERTYTVTDEIRNVFADNDALPQNLLAESGDERDDFGPGFLPGDHLQKLHVSGRIEEVRPEEMLLEFRPEVGRDLPDRNAGGIRGHDAIRPDHLFDPGKKVLFDLQILNDDLNHPVHIGKPAQVVLEIAGPDHGCVLLGEEAGGP